MPKTDQDQIRDCDQIISSSISFLRSEDIEREHIAKLLEGALRIIRRIEDES